MKKITYFLLLSAFFSCKEAKANNADTIIIKGTVKGIPATKLYLTDAYEWQKNLDSADYKNDTFTFRLPAKNFKLFCASIKYNDSTSNGRRRGLFIQNDMLSDANNNYKDDGFILDRGITYISGTFINEKYVTPKTKGLTLSGSKQNIPYFRTQLMGLFGGIGGDSTKRRKIINTYKYLINQYPDSYYFIWGLYNNRFDYTTEELAELVPLFKNTYATEDYLEKFKKMFTERKAAAAAMLNYRLKNIQNERIKIINNSSKLNMLVFWATWCAPCKLEEPHIKGLYNEFKNKGLHLVSISIDENKEAWKSFVKKDSTGWEQLIVDNTSREDVQNRFNVSGVPAIIFIDNQGVEIGRFVGYNQGDENIFKEFIQKHLN